MQDIHESHRLDPSLQVSTAVLKLGRPCTAEGCPCPMSEIKNQDRTQSKAGQKCKLHLRLRFDTEAQVRYSLPEPAGPSPFVKTVILSVERHGGVHSLPIEQGHLLLYPIHY